MKLFLSMETMYIQPKHKKRVNNAKELTRKQIKDKTEIRKNMFYVPSVYIRFFMQQMGYYKDSYSSCCCP